MTTYRLATAPMDYRRCHAMLKERGATNTLRRPTLLAERDGDLIGFLGTEAAYTDKIVAGPLVVSEKVARPQWLVLRLCDLYEQIMREAGVKAYLFCTPTANARLVTWCAKLGAEPFQQQGDYLWYLREVA